MNLDKFRDSNNFLQKNNVKNTYNRYWVGMDEKKNEFLSVKVNSPYTNTLTIFNLNYSRDGGNTFAMESNQILYGTYFFLGQNLDKYSYEVVNFISLVSELGGFIEFMYITLSLIPIIYNSRLVRKKFIDKLYFIDKTYLGQSEKT